MSTVESEAAFITTRTDHAARVTFDLRCPQCGREVHVRNVEIGHGDVSAICCGCDHTPLTLEWMKS